MFSGSPSRSPTAPKNGTSFGELRRLYRYPIPAASRCQLGQRPIQQLDALLPMPQCILAIPIGEHPATTSINALARAITKKPLHFDLRLASLSGQVVLAGRLTLSKTQLIPDEMHPNFDPVLSCPAELVLCPRWLTTARADAYQGSRKGRAVTRPMAPSRPATDPTTTSGPWGVSRIDAPMTGTYRKHSVFTFPERAVLTYPRRLDLT